MRKSLALVLALFALLAGLLSGCSTLPSTAATVGGVVIGEDQVDRVAKKLADLSQGNAAEARPDAVSVLAQAELSRQILAQHPEIKVSEEDRAAMRQRLNPAVLADPDLKRTVAGIIDLQIMEATLGEDGLRNAAASIPVTLNPRYGRWDGLAADGSDRSLARTWTQN